MTHTHSLSLSRRYHSYEINVSANGQLYVCFFLSGKLLAPRHGCARLSYVSPSVIVCNVIVSHTYDPKLLHPY